MRVDCKYSRAEIGKLTHRSISNILGRVGKREERRERFAAAIHGAEIQKGVQIRPDAPKTRFKNQTRMDAMYEEKLRSMRGG